MSDDQDKIAKAVEVLKRHRVGEIAGMLLNEQFRYASTPSVSFEKSAGGIVVNHLDHELVVATTDFQTSSAPDDYDSYADGLIYFDGILVLKVGASKRYDKYGSKIYFNIYDFSIKSLKIGEWLDLLVVCFKILEEDVKRREQLDRAEQARQQASNIDLGDMPDFSPMKVQAARQGPEGVSGLVRKAFLCAHCKEPIADDFVVGLKLVAPDEWGIYFHADRMECRTAGSLAQDGDCSSVVKSLQPTAETAMPFCNKPVDTTSFVSNFTSDPTKNFGVYAKGYRLAADRLATLLVAASRFSDYEAYPVVFLYRHALELSLKHLIYSAAYLAAFRYIDDIENRLFNHHNLSELCKVAKLSLSLLFPTDQLLLDLMPRVESTCTEFASLDPDSFCYRYPADKRGQASNTKNQTVNLTALATHLSSLLDELETVHFGLAGETDVTEELYFAIQSILCAYA